MTPIDIFELAIAADGKAPLGQTIQDAWRIYGVVTKIKASGHFDAAVMVKDGTLAAVAESGARLLSLVDTLLKDPVQAPRVAALVEKFAL